MISIFIMLIVAIALVAGIGYATLTLIRSGEVSLSIQKNQVTVETAASSVRGALSFGDGRFLVPVAVVHPEDGGPVPLSSMPDVSPGKSTAYGRPLVHCPVGGSLDGHEPNWSPEATGVPAAALPYRALVVEGPGGRHYVAATEHASTQPGLGQGETVWSKMRDRGIVSFIISPPPNATGIPDCRNVEFADPAADDWTLIMPADGSGITAVHAPAGMPGSRTLAVGDPSAFGDIAPSTLLLRTLEDAVRYVEAFGLQTADIRLQPGIVHTVSEAGFSSLVNGPASRSVELRSEGGTVTLVIADGPPAPFVVRGTLSMEGVTFGDAPVFFEVGPSGTLEATDFAAEGATVSGGSVFLSGAELGSLSVSGGSVRLGGESGIRSRIAVHGGNLHLADGDLIVLAPDGRPFSVTGNGTISASVSPYPITVVDPVTDVATPISYVPGPVSVTNEICGSDPWTCAAECPSAMQAVSGGCWLLDSSVNPLIGSASSADGTGWQCAWSGVPDHIISPPGPKRAQAYCR